jgi:predicted DNA-binding protein with PD1-like motif
MRFERFEDRYVVRLESGEPTIQTLTNFLRAEHVKFANLSAAGLSIGCAWVTGMQKRGPTNTEN